MAAGTHRVVDSDGRLGGAELASAVDGLAGRLRQAGVRRGDGVAFQLPNGAAAVCLLRACWRLGAVAVPINRAAGPADVEASVAAARPRLVLGGEGSPAAALDGAVEVLSHPDGFGALPDGPPVGPEGSAARPADLAAVIFTSGSTGRPKAVLHTQRGLVWKTVTMGRAHGLVPGDVVLTPAPLSHVSGLLNGVLLPAALGTVSVLMPRWDPERAVELLATERVTVLTGPPTFVVGLTGAPNFDPGRASTLRLVSVGGAPVTPAFVAGASGLLGCRVKRTYGSSEAPMVTTTFPSDPAERASGTDGRSAGGAELRVVDPVDGRPLPAGSPGELWVRGPELFVGYADQRDNAGRVARGGWFRTGDLATVDGDGWLAVAGRLDDVIIRGGENVSAVEVEGVLEAHPDVGQAAAVPYPDPLMGERVAAVVVAPATFDLDACRRWFSARGLARHKAPERLVRLPALPTLASGKVDRAALRALVAGPSSAGASAEAPRD
ncbi:MAG: class I adenylate-forming enzyme family protein [Acidimicrobiales bacterium]